MFEALAILFTSPSLLVWMLVAIPIGLVFGVIPGLGGKIAIISVMPFIFGMDVQAGCVFLISLHAVVHTGGALPSILLGVPGTAPSTAIVADGYALTKNGEAIRAISASVFSSAIGGVIGALFIAVLIPFSLILLKLFSYPEIFLLTLFGVAFAAILSGNSLLKGLITGCLGLTIAFVGVDIFYGIHRFTFGQYFLWDGVDTIVAVLSVYAIPEMINLGRSSSEHNIKKSPESITNQTQIRMGFMDVVRFRWLVLRASIIGAIIGAIPGLGGDVAAWFCYGHAAHTSPNPEKFGKGAIDGVIGPEAANNSKEGGALVPTLFLGIPGSSGMAILLIALIPLGLVPGPTLALEQPNLIWLMVWSLLFSNIIAAVLLLLMADKLFFLTKVHTKIIVPYVYILAILSVYLSSNDWHFLILMLVMSLVGYVFKKQNWPRAPFVIGLILGPATEDALIKSVGIWGADFLLRPVSLMLIGILFFSMVRIARNFSSRSKLMSEAADDTS